MLFEKRRYLIIVFALAARIALSAGSAHADEVVTFQSAPIVGDLVCPQGGLSAHKPEPAVAPSTTPGASPVIGMPSRAELGPLQRTVIRPLPRFASETIPGLQVKGNEHGRRIAFWGDSHLAGGPFAPTLMDVLRDRGLRVDSHFLPPSMGRPNTHVVGVRASCVGPAWSTEQAYTAGGEFASGPGLIERVAHAGYDSYFWIDLRDADRHAAVQQLQLIYAASPASRLQIQVNDGRTQTVSIDSSAVPQIITLRGDAPISTVKFNVLQGSVTLQGFALNESPAADVILDIFGLPSSTIRGWANASPTYLKQSLEGASYDGIVLEYGTNEGNDPDFSVEKYTELLTHALTHVRDVFPTASCVLVGPPDRGVLKPAHARAPDLLRFSHIHQQIAQIQRRVGQRFGCEAWDWQAFMGGAGGSYGWALGTPRLMGHDLIHLSPEGYRRTAHGLATSLGWEP